MSNPITIKVTGVPEHFNLPWYLAIEEGAFARAGIDLQWQDAPGGTGAMMQSLQNEEADVAIALTEGVVTSIIKGTAARIARVFVTSPLTWGIHVAAHKDFQKVEDVRGRRFAISRPTSGSHLMAFVLAQQKGWDSAGIPFVEVGGIEGARKALAEEEADAFMWEKFMTKPLVDRGEFRRVGEIDTPWPCFVVAVRNKVLESKGEAVQKMLKVINEYAANIKQRPDALELISSRFALPEEDAAAWLSKTEWSGEVSVDTAMLTQVMQTLTALGAIGHPLPVDEIAISRQE
ncbi:sulfonate transport system substrate-binding protein [Catalinimonas alkaloidigena]|uniref:substrate-binding domain-containing protein n=1 Tax=Catalinimonas alkaloidigena TaxID=1075417 RepID=UPI0024060DC3|nr:substrate-binding domain-containing protein [Catalinimonas alkaloidigena]MDF9798222.1 sulfonate transport system substrate-binding protein [Catalinimonas alkaloidigena]